MQKNNEVVIFFASSEIRRCKFFGIVSKKNTSSQCKSIRWSYSMVCFRLPEQTWERYDKVITGETGSIFKLMKTIYT